jgi:DNA-binding MarR family transcriptional regulator
VKVTDGATEVGARGTVSAMKTTTGAPKRRRSATQSPSSRSPRTPTELIEAQLSPLHEPVLGLYLHVAYHCFMASFEDIVGRGEITPNLIGVLALLADQPGMSQADLARVIGLERATVGVQVARVISLGFLSRDKKPGKGRRYALRLTERGRSMLAKLRERIPSHERFAGARLSLPERKQLRELLTKLVYG